MKNLKTALVLAFGFTFCFAGGYCADKKSAPAKTVKKSGGKAEKKSETRVTVYYFHGGARCSSCRKLEQYTKEAVEQNFSTGAYAGKVVFAALDVDEKANEHFVDDYQLVAKAVILQPEKNGVAGKWENMDQIWLLLGDKEKFKDYVKNGVLKQLEAK